MPIAQKFHKRLKIRTILLLVNISILLVMIAGFNLLTIYENTLIRQTEAELNSQAYFIGAILKQRDGAPPQEESGWSPVAVTLDLAVDPIHPGEPDLIATQRSLSQNEQSISLALNPILKEAQRFALSSIQVLNTKALVMASTNTEQVGWSMSNREEVQGALAGEHQSLLRAREVKYPNHVFSSISRSGHYRVHIAHPVTQEGKVTAVIVASRTPQTMWQTLLLNQRTILTYITIAILLIWGLSVATALTINRPIEALIKQAQRALNGEQSAIQPLARPITAEVNELSETLAELSRNLEQRSAYIVQFASSVSHEFKTPVTAIQGAVELLLDHHDSMSRDELKKFLQNIHQGSIRLENLVQRLLELAKADYATNTQYRCNVMTTLKGIDDWLVSRNIHITANFQLEPDIQVALSDEVLHSIVENLIANAQQANATAVDVWVGQEADKVIIKIRDNGSGISAANAQEIFKPFFTTKRDIGGTGLGLSIIRSLLQQAKGTIELITTEHGAAFKIMLPQA